MESSKIVPRKKFKEDFARKQGIPRGIFEDKFEHLVIIFKLLAFFSNKFNDLMNNCMSILLKIMFQEIFEYQISELRSFLKDPH